MKKRLMSVLTICLVAFMMFQVPMAYAKNNTDTAWSFNFDPYSLERYTEARHKEDDSSIYFYVNKLGKVNNQYFIIRVVKGDFSELSYTKRELVDRIGMYCLSSYAYEDYGYGVKVRVRGDRIENRSVYSSGVWSPDSYGCWE